jgi:N6-adenosine-specific RNA methylase IME4
VILDCTFDEVVAITDAVQKYDVLYADPPWFYDGNPNKPQAAGKHYKMMKEDELKKLPIKSIMKKNAVAFVWATCPKLDVAIRCIEAWGLVYRGVAFNWIKTTNAGKIIGAQGSRPSYVKPTSELLLVASTHKSGRTFELATESVQQVVLAPRPNNQHSRKPDIFRQNIEDLFSDRSLAKIELFARRDCPNWDVWGNEL